MVQVPTGIISQLAHPPYGLLTRTAGPIPLTAGVTSIQIVSGPVTVNAFGITFHFFTVPGAFGWSQRIHKDYEHPIVEFAALYTLFDGSDRYGPSEVLTHESDLYYFDQLLPKRIDVWVQTGCVVTYDWLQAL